MTSADQKHRAHLAAVARALETERGRSFGPGARAFPGIHLISMDGKVAVVAHAYGWREGGKAPHALLDNARASVRLLNALPAHVEKLLVLAESPHPETGETLAAHLARKRGVDWRDVALLELPAQGGPLRVVLARGRAGAGGDEA